MPHAISMMPLAAPAIEPVSLAEAKQHLRLDSEVEDQMLTTLITSVRLQLEALLGLALIDQSWRVAIAADGLGQATAVRLPLRPLAAVADPAIVDAAGNASPIAPEELVLRDRHGDPAVAPAAGLGWPLVAAGGRLEFTVTAGFGPAASDVPAPLRQALLLLLAHAYERRLPGSSGVLGAELQSALAPLLTPYRRVRL